VRVLVVGSGAREHAIVWKLAQSDRVSSVYAAPGNAGTAVTATNLAIDGEDFSGLNEAVKKHRIELIVVGPEIPLAGGIVDYFNKQGVPIFGPSREAAAIEASKTFAKDIMRRYGIPCAESETFDDFASAKDYIEGLSEPPVIKADGLAAGKGVTVPESFEEAIAALDRAMVGGVFGAAGRRVVIEERLRGVEASVFAFTDGETAVTTIPACDYKRVLDDDGGPNTGGMGSYSPPEFLDDSMVRRVNETIMTPTVQALAREGKPFKGVLYAGLMVDGASAKVFEFNCRLGDPETQVILPRLETDLLTIIEAVIEGRLDRTAIEWSGGASVAVVMSSGGYPGSYGSGYPITGLDDVDPDVAVFHAGTKLVNGEPVTAGGRVLTVAARGRDLAEARDRAYTNVERVRFEGAHYRKDIALRAIETTRA
jgi:phosphoribosylamine--glycine ligase